MPDSNAINNPFLDDQNTTKTNAQDGSKFDPSTAKPVANTTPASNNKNSKFDPSTAKAVDKGFGGHVRDLGASLMGGLAAVPEVAVGVADLYTGGRAGKAVDNLSDNFKLGDGQKYWQDKKTDHAKVQSQEFADAEGIIDKTKVALSNPSMITNTVVESLPSMALGGLAGRGLNVASKGLINPVAAGAAGEGLVMAGAQAEQIRQKTDDGLLTGKQTAAAAGTGVAGSLLGFLGGTVARKLGFEDVDTLMARGVKPEQVAGEISQIPFSSIPKSVVLGAISEGLLEEMPQSVTEQVLQNYALDKDLFEGVDDAIVMGTLAGMAMGGTVAGTSQASKWVGQPITGNPEASDDPDTTGSTPMLPAPTGGNGGAPGLSFDDLQGEYIPADQQGATEQAQARQNFEYDQMSTDADNQINYSGQSPQSVPKPSEQMGLDPNLGPLSAAAVTAVDSGMSQQMQIEMQAKAAAESASNSTEKNIDNNAPLQQAADAVRDLTPEQIHGKQSTYGAEVSTAIEQLKQRQQGDKNVPITIDESNQNGTAQQGNAPIDNGSQSLSQQYDTVATSTMGTETGAAQKGLQPAQSDAGQASQPDQNPNEIQTSEAKSKLNSEIQTSEVQSQLDSPPGLIDTKQVAAQQLSRVDNDIANVEQQLQVEKSVPKKMRMHKQLEGLNAERTAIVEKHALAPVQAQEQDLGKIQTVDSNIQTKNNQSKVSELEAQLVTEESVAKKAQLRKQIAELQKDSPIDQAAHQAATSIQNDSPEPTQAQIEAGNYKKGHIKVHGLDIAVENPRGSERRGTDPDGKGWAHTMSDHYGYIKKTTGADNEHIDTYIGRNPESDQIFIVDQIDQKTGGFDEHKVMMGFNSQEDAIQAYSSNFDKGWKVGPVKTMNKDEFKTWLKDGDTKKPAGESVTPQSEATLDPQSVQRDYGDSLESVMSDVETLADDFTIDLHSVPKKRNALKNPNYHAVQHENGRVEILGMKHPATGKWVGKEPRQGKAPVQEQSKDIKSNSPEKQDSSSQSLNIQIQSASGLVHSIPSKLMDQVHKLGDVVSDLVSMKTAGVKTNVLYGKQLLAKIAKLNPDVQIHIVSDLNNIQDKTIRAGLVDGGYYVLEQKTSYIYPKSGAWNSSVLELLNHELVHSVSEQIIFDGLIPQKHDQKLNNIITEIGEYLFENSDLLSENSVDRLVYAFNTNPQHEVLAVGTAETEVRNSLKKILGNDGLLDLDGIFTAITEQFGNSNEQRKQSSNIGNGKKILHGTVPSTDTGAAGKLQDVPTGTESSKKRERSTGVDQANSSIGEKQQGLINNDNGQIKQRSSSRDDKKGTSQGISGDASGVSETVSTVRTATSSSKNIGRGSENQSTSVSSTEKNKVKQSDSDTPLYSRAKSQDVKGSTPEQVREALVKRFGEKTISSLEKRGLLDIISTVDEPGVEGFYQNGRVTLVASNLNETSIIPTFLHELGGHGGFQNTMSREKYTELMGIFNDMVKRKHPLALEAKRLAERESNSETQQLEYLPYLLTLASTQQEMNALQKSAIKRFIDKVVSAVKAWAFDRLGINLNLNENDLVALANRMIQQKIAEPISVDNVRAQLQGTDQWMKAPNGKPTNLTEQQWLQVRTPEFKQWFGDWENNPESASKVVDENGEPQVVYHGTSSQFTRFKLGGGLLGRGVYLTDRYEEAQNYAGSRSQDNKGMVMPLFANIKNVFETDAKTTREQILNSVQKGLNGIRHQFNDMSYLVAFNPEQVKSAVDNTGLFSNQDTDIRFSRQANAQQIIQNLVGNMNKQGRDKLKTEAGYKAIHALQYVLGALGRRQLTELYQKLLPQLKPYNDMVAMMDADQNEVAALSDDLARRWADLKDEKELANVMHDATLAKIDPAKPYQPGDNIAEYTKLKKQFDALSGDAKKVYREARDTYKKHHRDVRQAIQDRILRSSMSNQKKTELLQQMDANFFGYTQGVYFPLQRFGKYVVVAKNNKGEVLSVSRAETLSEAHKLREVLLTEYPGSNVLEPKLDKEFNAARDGVGRGFMTTLFNELGSLGLNAKRQTELEDILGQLYLKSLPDLSYAKHSIHRKGTAGFSQDARRAFAQNMFHGGSYLAKLRYKDQLEEMLDGMQKHANDEFNAGKGYDQRVAQQVIDEMNKRHKNMMEANSHPLSTALTSLGFLYYLGLSPASAAVNTLQTVLVAYPQMGAKWGYDKAGAALAQASNDFCKGVSINGINPKNWENDIAKILKGDELKAYEEAVRRGVIDVTMAHDLAGIAQGEDSGVMWKLRPIMRVASTLFHNAERFNREVTFIAAYRLARDSGSMHDQAFEQAMDSTYNGHFDYSSGNRPRIMQGNIAKVIFLFKQFGQNMIYTLARTAHQSLKGETPEARREAQRALVGIIGMHTVFAGVMGLPLVGPILAVASMLGSDDDEPWDAEAALRNALADALGTKTSEVLMKGASRFGPADLSGRVGINNLLLPDVQDGLEGKDFSDAMVMSGLGPVVGILTNTFKGLAEMGQGHGMRGVETMSPVFLRSPLRSIRYATEGAQDKTGVMIKDDVGMLSLAAQAVGFSPSEVRLATEGRSAIYSHTKRLDKRRTELMNDYVRAVQRDDMDGQKEIWAEIQAFNQKNPSRRISRVQAMQSLRQREKRVKQAEHGIYLPNKKREDADIGRFAFDE